MMKRNFLNSPQLLELKRRRRKVFQNKIILSVLGFLAFFSLLVFVSRSRSLNISSVEIKGEDLMDATGIKELAEKVIKGNFLWLFPKSNILFYPKGEIIKELFTKYRGLSDIKFAVISGNILQLSLSERSAAYIWCGDAPPDIIPESDEIRQKCFFADKDGYIFDEAARFSGDVYFKLYGSTSSAGNTLVPEGYPSGTFFAGENFSRMINFKSTLESMELKPVALYAEENGNVKIFLSGRTQPLGPEIIFKIDSDLQSVVGNLEAALATEPLSSTFKNKYSSLQYIDLRYGNKVYFKIFTKGVSVSGGN